MSAWYKNETPAIQRYSAYDVQLRYSLKQWQRLHQFFTVKCYKVYPGKRSSLKYCKKKCIFVLSYANQRALRGSVAEEVVTGVSGNVFLFLFLCFSEDDAVGGEWGYFVSWWSSVVSLWFVNVFAYLGEVFLWDGFLPPSQHWALKFLCNSFTYSSDCFFLLLVFIKKKQLSVIFDSF